VLSVLESRGAQGKAHRPGKPWAESREAASGDGGCISRASSAELR